NKIMLITGSARGIGAATARLAHQRGAKVILHGRADSEPLRQLARELDDTLVVICNVADKQVVQKSINDLFKKVDRVDVLVNCAGTIDAQPFLESDDDNWLKHYQVNVLGAVHFCQAIIP